MQRRHLLLAIGFATVILTGCASTAHTPRITWRALPELPEASGGHLVLDVRGKVMVLGGTDWVDGKKRWLDSVLWLNEDENRWVSDGSLPFPVAYAVGGVRQGSVLMAGGNTTGSLHVEQALLRRPDGVFAVFPQKDAPVYGAAFVQSGDVLYDFGGIQDGDDWSTVSADLRTLDIKRTERGWKQLPSLPGCGRAFAATCVYDNELYVFGGADSEIRNLSECWKYSLARGKWMQLEDSPCAMRCSLAFPWGEWIVVVACCVTEPSGEAHASDLVYFFNPKKGKWLEGGRTPFPAITYGLLKDGQLYILGGEDKDYSRIPTCACGTLE